MSKIWNNDFIQALDELEEISKNKGEIFRARAYKVASDSILSMPEDIHSVEQIKGKHGIGDAIYKKLESLQNTGKINAIEREKDNVLHQLCKVYGIGPKKALELSKVVNSIEELKQRPDLTNNKQKIGLLAQEIETVFPELVSENNNIKSVNYQGLVPVLINAIKEQHHEIERLKKQEERLRLLEQKVNALLDK
mgnify:CR=1 FL=1